MHKVERWSTEIALRLSESMAALLGFEASSLVWDPVLIPEQPDPGNLDPNYLSQAEFEHSPWHTMLCEWAIVHGSVPRLHIDVHGKRDRKTNWDIDVGTAALQFEWRDALLPIALRDTLCNELENALAGTKYTVNREPELDGMWGGDCYTMAHQSVCLGTPAIQLEIPRSLRADLTADDALFARFARAIAVAYKTVIVDGILETGPRSAADPAPAKSSSTSGAGGKGSSSVPNGGSKSSFSGRPPVFGGRRG